MELIEILNKFEKSKIKAGDGRKDGIYPLYTCSPKVNKFLDNYLYDTEAIILGTGGNPVINYHKGKFSYSSDCLVVQSKGKFENKYIYYYLISKINEIAKMFRGAGLKHLNKKEFFKMNIELINIEEQKKIIKELDLINKLMDYKRKQIKLFDDFIKSQFVEMFGNPIINDKKFEFKQIGEVTKIVTGTTPDTNNIENWNGRINWITPAEIKDDTLYVYDTQRKITEKGQKSKALTLMPKGTVIFSTRAPIGKTAIAGNEMCCNQGFKNCICSININNIYLYYVLKNNKIYFNNLGTGATFKELSKRVFEKVKIAVPLITLQNQFSEIVKQIDKQKFESMIQLDKENRIVLRNIIKDTLEETNSIYEFLLKKYFEEGK